jgi:HEPN domain-containing protein/predicted nucleotidyltransferase
MDGMDSLAICFSLYFVWRGFIISAMKTELSHLPQNKQDELAIIAETIRKEVDRLEMIILFGSYARGNWVEDIYTEGHNTYEYKSDFDILAVTATESAAQTTGLWRKVKTAIKQQNLDTPVTLIVHDIGYLNRKIKKGQYFFSDIQKEGIILYDSGNFELAEEQPLSPKERAGIAKADFKQWFESAKDFYESYKDNFEADRNKIAAFDLHQAAEALYSCVVLVFSNYKPKSHDLDELGHLAANHDPAFITAFPKNSDEEKKCFELLNDAYVKARYDKGYKITKEQLEYLAERVKVLRELTERVCREKIESFV